MRGAGANERAVFAGRPVPPQWPPTRRGRYVARIVVYALVIVSTAMGLASHRTGELVWFRIALLVSASIFLVATVVDFARMRNKL